MTNWGTMSSSGKALFPGIPVSLWGSVILQLSQLLTWNLHFPFLLPSFRLGIVSLKAPLRCDYCSVTSPTCSGFWNHNGSWWLPPLASLLYSPLHFTEKTLQHTGPPCSKWLAWDPSLHGPLPGQCSHQCVVSFLTLSHIDPHDTL